MAQQGTDSVQTSGGNSGDTKQYESKESNNDWTAPWPSPADFHFNYHKLLNAAGDKGLGKAPDNNKEQPRIAIIGAGSAGLTACRELVNCGFINVTLYEATDRIGGRHVSIPALSSSSLSTYEMGAMRFPLFNNISISKHYIKLFDITHCPFPNPLSDYATTGVFWNGMYFQHPKDKNDNNNNKNRKTNKNGETLEKLTSHLTKKWTNFKIAFLNGIPKIETSIKKDSNGNYISFKYDETKFWDWWADVIDIYSGVSFRGFALAKPAIEKNSIFPTRPNNCEFDYQGLGCNETESSILYTVGIGDGGWGAFFDICVLWVFRTMLYGYGDNLQQIIGRINNNGTVNTDGYYYKTVCDSREPPNTINSPRHIGVESIDEGLFYLPNGNKHIPYEKVIFYSSSPVGNVHLHKVGTSKGNEKIQIQITTDFHKESYDHVIITTNVWDLPLDITQTLFKNTSKRYPLTMLTALRDSHFILSSKVFYPLKRQYWNENEMGKGNTLPEVWSTDGTCQGVYAMCGNNYALYNNNNNNNDDSKEESKKEVAYKHDKGVVMLSYTWEGDASKLLQFSNKPKEFAKVCLNTLDRLQSDTPALQEKPRLSSCVDQSRPVAIHWGTQRYYGGCSKLYRAFTEKRNMCEIAWNQFFGAKTGLYFAGEGFSLDGGWTEPAFRLAIDAVLHIINNTKNATFRDDIGFDFEKDYPKWHYIDDSWYQSQIPLWKLAMKGKLKSANKKNRYD